MKTRNECREWRELLGAYALGHLDGDERAALEAHLEGCLGCREELAALAPLARMLPHADPARFELAPQPPPELGRRIAATIEGEKQRAQQRRRRRALGGLAFGGAAAAALAAVLLLFVFGGSSEDASQPVRFTDLPSGISIDATLEPHAFGTEIHMYVSGCPRGRSAASGCGARTAPLIRPGPSAIAGATTPTRCSAPALTSRGRRRSVVDAGIAHLRRTGGITGGGGDRKRGIDVSRSIYGLCLLAWWRCSVAGCGERR